MQKEVNQKTVALSIKAAKLTAEVLQAAIKKYLEARRKGKNTLRHGEQSSKSMGPLCPTLRSPMKTSAHLSPVRNGTA